MPRTFFTHIVFLSHVKPGVIVNTEHPWPPLRGVVFDLDGTLVELAIDFDALRHELGCPQRDILGYLQTLGEDKRQQAMKIIERYETVAGEQAILTPGAFEVLSELSKRRVKTAILTRNSARSAARVIEKFNLPVDLIIGRDEAPPKPSPEALFMIAEAFNLPIRSIGMVGDFLYDLLCAREAGTAAILYLTPRTEQFMEHCDFAIQKLTDLYPLVIDSVMAFGSRD